MFVETKYSFSFLECTECDVAGFAAGASSLVLETRLPVSGLRNVSSSRRLDDISRLLSLVSRPLDETSLSVVCALEGPVSMCSYNVKDIHMGH